MVLAMMPSRLARRLGVDRNPLRRRTDKIAAWLAALLVVMFLVGAPAVSLAAIGWVGRSAATWQHAARSWHQVLAVVTKASPEPPSWSLSGYAWVRARWTAPDGRARAGLIPVTVGVAAGQTVRVWVDAVGTPTGPPLTTGMVVADEVRAAAVAVILLGVVLLCLMGAGRQVLDRRALAGWEADWAAVGPQWTRRFRYRE
jgi:hypothetical protein